MACSAGVCGLAPDSVWVSQVVVASLELCQPVATSLESSLETALEGILANFAHISQKATTQLLA